MPCSYLMNSAPGAGHQKKKKKKDANHPKRKPNGA